MHSWSYNYSLTGFYEYRLKIFGRGEVSIQCYIRDIYNICSRISFWIKVIGPITNIEE